MAASMPVAHQLNPYKWCCNLFRQAQAEFSFNMLNPIEAWWLSG